MTNRDLIACIAIWVAILSAVAFTIAALADKEDNDNVEEA